MTIHLGFARSPRSVGAQSAELAHRRNVRSAKTLNWGKMPKRLVADSRSKQAGGPLHAGLRQKVGAFDLRFAEDCFPTSSVAAPDFRSWPAPTVVTHRGTVCTTPVTRRCHVYLLNRDLGRVKTSWGPSLARVVI